MIVKCDYCGKDARLVYGTTIYPNRFDLHSLGFWQCKPCNAYVGCHTNTDKPLGRLANEELREWKIMAHAAFDPLWKGDTRRMTRHKAYGILSGLLELPRDKTHIGMFDVDMCKKVVQVMLQYNQKGGNDEL